MKRSKIAKIAALATLVSAAEATINQGAVDVSMSNYDKLLKVINSEAPSINTSKSVRDSIYSILDTIRIDTNSVVNTDLLRSYMFMHSQDSIGPLYNSIDAILDSTKSNVENSQVITKDFIKSYIRMRVEEKSPYDKDQLLSKSIIDTIPLNLKYIDRTTFDALGYVESRYYPKAHNESGASGVYQLMPATYKDNGEGDFETNRFIPKYNIPAGINYLDYLETYLPKEYNKLNHSSLRRRWDKLSLDDQVDFIVMAYNVGHGFVRDKKFDTHRMPQETIEYPEKLRDAKLIVSLDHLTNFNALIFSDTTTLLNFATVKATQDNITSDNLSDTTRNIADLFAKPDSYSATSIIAHRIRDITLLLESTENYLSKHFPAWKNMDIKTQQELVVAASTYGPRMFMNKVKANKRNKDWNFRYISQDVSSRIYNFNDKQFLENMRYAWDYSEKNPIIKDNIDKNYIKTDNTHTVKTYNPSLKIVDGTRQLIDLENQLTKTKALDWNSITEDRRRELLTVAAITGYNTFKQNNFNPLKLSKADQEKLKAINYAFDKYSKVSEYHRILTDYKQSDTQD